MTRPCHTITVQALHTFRAGHGVHVIDPGTRRLVVKGSSARADGAPFWAEDRRGQRFPQLFRVGEAHGWRVVGP